MREALERHVASMHLRSTTDTKGNLMVSLGESDMPKIVVAAHMDEIAMIVRRIEPEGYLAVESLGGLFPWKIGEGPVKAALEACCCISCTATGALPCSSSGAH